ncbi:hypothetical protein TNCV_1316171 [Trichonephila clavipes]|nr:hypothetical protein TNCV_1316171 [Trichonephila clavipes]
MAVHVMGATIPNIPSVRRFRMVREDTGPLVKVIPVPEWRWMKQLTVRVHLLRCVGLLNDCSVEAVLRLGGRGSRVV